MTSMLFNFKMLGTVSNGSSRSVQSDENFFVLRTQCFSYQPSQEAHFSGNLAFISISATVWGFPLITLPILTMEL